jgi:hypothetical protein
MRFIFWCWCWSLFWTGHFVSRVLVDIYPDVFYPIYSNLMGRSFDIDKVHEFGVWTKGE